LIDPDHFLKRLDALIDFRFGFCWHRDSLMLVIDRLMAEIFAKLPRTQISEQTGPNYWDFSGIRMGALLSAGFTSPMW
tara:strand:+ start:601 stop:834 length:234 start_codon:yes stop_codon:yes gene_type:complete